MGRMCSLPVYGAASGRTRPGFAASKVTVAWARTATGHGRPVNPERPDGISREKMKARCASAVDPAHQSKLQRPEAAGKARAEYPVHDDVRAAPLADGSVGIHIPRRIAVFFGPARSRGKRHAATPGQPHMLPRHAPVGPQRPGMQHKHLGASVVQMPGKTSGVPAVVAAAHEQQDALARHLACFSRKHMQGLAGGVFHQQQVRASPNQWRPDPSRTFPPEREAVRTYENLPKARLP